MNPHTQTWLVHPSPHHQTPNRRTKLIRSFIFGPIALPCLLVEKIQERKAARNHSSEPWILELRKQRLEKEARESLYQAQRSIGNYLKDQSHRTQSSSILEFGPLVEKACPESFAAHPNSQSQSQILALPASIRVKIWNLVLGGHDIAIFRGHHRLLHQMQSEHHSTETEYGSGMPNFYQNPQSTYLAALLKTCRLVYFESVPILYDRNRLSLWHNDTLFLLASTTPPLRFSSIRYLTLHWQFRNDFAFETDSNGRLAINSVESNTSPEIPAPWNAWSWSQSCNILKDMQNLEELLILIRGPFYTNQYVVDMLQPLRDIKVPFNRFRVRVPWPRVISLSNDDALDRRMENEKFPFQVIRSEQVIPDVFDGLELIDY